MPLPEARRGYPGYGRAGFIPDRPVHPSVARSRGYEIAFDDVGSGPPVVLLHGITLSGGDWWETGAVDLLVRDGFRALVVDPLGHGQSGRPHDPTSYRYPDVALDTLAAMDLAGVERAVVWGYSRGAVLAACLAIEAPDRVEALVVGGSSGMEQSPPTELPEWLTRMMGGDWPAFWDTPVGSSYSKAQRSHAEVVFDPGALAAAMASRRLYPYALRLSAVRCPVLLYEGGDDGDPEEVAATAAGLGTSPRVLQGLDHDTASIESGRVWEIVRPFLDAASSRDIRQG